MKNEDYYLDLIKVNKINDIDDKNRIHNYYTEMLNTTDPNTKLSLFKTLKNVGYLICDENEEMIKS